MSNVKNIKVGDLVRLKDDNDKVVGIGLVLNEKSGLNILEESNLEEETDEMLEDIEEFLLYKPVYLVLWQGETISPNDSPVWMFSTELSLVD